MLWPTASSLVGHKTNNLTRSCDLCITSAPVVYYSNHLREENCRRIPLPAIWHPIWNVTRYIATIIIMMAFDMQLIFFASTLLRRIVHVISGWNIDALEVGERNEGKWNRLKFQWERHCVTECVISPEPLTETRLNQKLTNVSIQWVDNKSNES